jgi:hypothetical protein
VTEDETGREEEDDSDDGGNEEEGEGDLYNTDNEPYRTTLSDDDEITVNSIMKPIIF